MKKLIFFIVLVICISCQNKESKPTVAHNNSFFDIEDYINQYYQQFLKTDSIVQINVLNGKKETIKKDSSSMNALKDIIRKSDINSSVLYDKYHVEILENAEIYTALDSTLQTRKVIVEKEDNHIKKVIITQAYNNLLSEAQTIYTILESGKIIMEKNTQTKFQDDDHLEVTWDFNKNETFQ